MRVHVTGASGFLGSHVTPILVARGHEVTALARSDRAAQRIADLGARPISGDLDDPALVDQAFSASGAEALVNLASLGFGHAPTVVAAAEAAGLRRAIFISTTAVFTTLDARSRAMRTTAEDVIRSSSLEWTIIRPTMIYGTSADRNMARLLSAIRRSPLLPLPGGGNRLQQPVHVADLAEAVVNALGRPATVGQHYDIAGPQPLTFRDVVEQAASAVGRAPRLLSVPLGPTVAALRLYECVSRQPRLRAEQVERLAEDKAFDITAARQDLGFNPRTFRDGIREEAAILA